MASNFPLLPGFAPTQTFKDNYRRVSSVKQEQLREHNNEQPTRYPLPRQPPFSETLSKTQNNMNKDYVSTTHEHFNAKTVLGDTDQLYQPDWVRLDRHVLRFYGYFKESVVESNLENARNRKIKLLFYLEDNSVAINEEKVENSGIPQGKFLRRQKVLRDDGKFFTAYDFRLGEPISIFGRMLFLYTCDDYTREFYEKAQCPQGPSVTYSDDQWSSKINDKWIPKKDAMMKEYLEKKLGGGRVNSQKQFLENDRKVLKFFSRCGVNRYIIHYFLADDTIEVRDVHQANSGRDPFPVTFRRQKLPAKFALNQPGQTYAEDFLKATDLQIGKQLLVFGTPYYLEGCDAFTKNYYAQKHGINFPDFRPNESYGHEPERSHIIIPPHNGIGSQEDSLGYIYRLIPKPPKKDFFKWVDQQIALRFTAMLAFPKPQDSNRRFITTYYLNDDSLQIYEIPTKNSGFSEGKFLERAKYKNTEGQVFKPEHLVIGEEVKINGYWFHITECDDFTKKWYAENTLWERVPVDQK